LGADIIRTPTRAEVERRLGVSLWAPIWPKLHCRTFQGLHPLLLSLATIVVPKCGLHYGTNDIS
jgi:hypothetical protein